MQDLGSMFILYNHNFNRISFKRTIMIETLKRLLGFGPSVDYSQLVKNGAIILDVRSKGEYAGGHIKDQSIFQ